jgi:hypothetical protein
MYREEEMKLNLRGKLYQLFVEFAGKKEWDGELEKKYGWLIEKILELVEEKK